ncbi:MAG: hypothetical protein EBT47_12075, partial [Chloroflexi bacterium]|nr:hypothetical protein [Chloroflexota bacterium]
RTECPPEVDALWGPDRLDDLLAESDFVVVCAPETPETRGLFNAERFSRMKQGAYFINIGRGRVVLLDPLVQALESGHLAGAALDVFEVEPLVSDHPLWGMPNVILTPHTAGVGSHEEDRRYEVLLEGERQTPNPDPHAHLATSGTWVCRRVAGAGSGTASRPLWSGAATPTKFIGIA